MKRICFLLLAAALIAWNASAQVSASSNTAASQETKASAEQSKKGADAKASGSASTSASASAQAGQSSVNLSSGTTFEAALSSSLDASKNKEGDQVVARTTQDVKSEGKVILPKGCKLIGHVTQAKARAKGESESALGIRFDRAILKNGQEVPLKVVIQAVAAAQSQTSAALDSGDMMGSAPTAGSMGGSGRASASGDALGGVGSTVGAAAGAVGNTAGAALDATANTAASATGAAKGINAAGTLTSSSSGVIGLKGLSLNSEASSATQGSLIVSSTRNVHLDSGTRMLLRAQVQSQ